ncbi:MAG: RNA methyltransferase [Saprospiraceae bacterium]|nr:RNA methyltransferase [Saprospiraceae bacterium]
MRKLKLQELNRLSEEQVKNAPKVPILLWLDNIRSGHNVGAAFRTGDAFRIEGLILSGFTPCPPHREILKTALGADQSVDWHQADDPISELKKWKGKGYKIYAVEQTDQSIPLNEFQIPDKTGMILIFGNEVKGVSEELLELCDSSIEIPQYGAKHSFNVSVSIGIVLWEFCRAYRYKSE